MTSHADARADMPGRNRSGRITSARDTQEYHILYSCFTFVLRICRLDFAALGISAANFFLLIMRLAEIYFNVCGFSLRKIFGRIQFFSLRKLNAANKCKILTFCRPGDKMNLQRDIEEYRREFMNGEKDFAFNIREHIGVIGTYSTGWKKELNLVEWNGKNAKFDIRDWEPSHEHMSRGITLHEDEAKALASLIFKFFANSKENGSKTRITSEESKTYGGADDKESGEN